MYEASFRCLSCAAEYREHAPYCIACGSFNRLFPLYRRPVETLWESDVLTSAAEFIKDVALERLEPYPIRVGRKLIAVFYGPPYAGKSTMVMRIGDAAQGPILYVPSDEGPSDALKLRLRRLEVCRSDFKIGFFDDVGRLDRAVEENSITTVILDSLNRSTLLIRDLVALSRHRDVSVVMTSEINAEGRIAGGMAVPHAVDLMVRVDGMRWTVEKSRFSQELMSGEVLS